MNRDAADRPLSSPIKYLPSAILFDTSGPDSFQQQNSADGAPNELIYDQADLPWLRMSKLAAPSLVLYYSELVGRFLRRSSAPANEIMVGLVVGGAVQSYLASHWHSVGPYTGTFRLPGEYALQSYVDAQAFTLLIPVDRVQLFQLKARSHRWADQIDHFIGEADARDLIELTAFVCSEYERLAQRDGAKSGPQLEILLETLRERTTRVFYKQIPLRQVTDPDPEMVRICVAVDAWIRANTTTIPSSESLAAAGACSLRQLYRAFEQIADTTPHEYQTRIRQKLIRHSIFRTLDASSMPAELAAEFGYRRPEILIKHYLEEYGETPEQTLISWRAKFHSLADQLMPARS